MASIRLELPAELQSSRLTVATASIGNGKLSCLFFVERWVRATLESARGQNLLFLNCMARDAARSGVID